MSVNGMLDAAGDMYEAGRHAAVLDVKAFIDQIAAQLSPDEHWQDGVNDAADAFARSDWAVWLTQPRPTMDYDDRDFDFADPAPVLALAQQLFDEGRADGLVEAIDIVAREADGAIETLDEALEANEGPEEIHAAQRYRDGYVYVVEQAQAHWGITDDQIGWA